MARRWQTITVQLISGRGERLEHPPGRVFLLPPRATFGNLGTAIDVAFARWDFSHLREFTLDDGTMVTGDESAVELRNSMRGAIPKVISLREVVRKRVMGVDTQLSYTFDLGDDWFHLCTFDGYADPSQVYGPDPSEPVPIWGWGIIPDRLASGCQRAHSSAVVPRARRPRTGLGSGPARHLWATPRVAWRPWGDCVRAGHR